MKFMGSKARHAKELLPIILKDRKPEQFYIEPFVGGANMIDKVDGNRIGNDIDEDLICLWQNVSKGWIPPKEFTEEQYKFLKGFKNDNNLPDESRILKGYVSFALSYGGKKWGGWCRDGAGKRNYVDEAYRNAIGQFPKLKGVKFYCSPYKDLYIPKDSIVYCDPPYANATKYKDDFNHEDFWQWVREISKNNTVYISEYNAPDDFECVWQKKVTSSLTKDTGSKKNVEKLWRLKK